MNLCLYKANYKLAAIKELSNLVISFIILDQTLRLICQSLAKI